MGQNEKFFKIKLLVKSGISCLTIFSYIKKSLKLLVLFMQKIFPNIADLILNHMQKNSVLVDIF